jgi:IS5 family transposase
VSFSQPFITHRTRKDKFYTQVNTLIDWHSIEGQIKQHYKANQGEVGRDGYSGLLLFKMLLLGIWNGLSDYATEELVNDSLSASAFCHLALEDDVPDHSVLSRFRSYMSKCGAFDQLLLNINTQLEHKNLMVKTVTKVDASITDSPRKPKGTRNL